MDSPRRIQFDHCCVCWKIGSRLRREAGPTQAPTLRYRLGLPRRGAVGATAEPAIAAGAATSHLPVSAWIERTKKLAPEFTAGTKRRERTSAMAPAKMTISA